MFGIIIIIAIVIFGGSIAFLGDRVGMKVGKKRLTLFGLRPKYTSMIITVLTGFFIAGLTISVLTMISKYARTAIFELSSIQRELKVVTEKAARMTTGIKQKEVELTRAVAQSLQVEKQYRDAAMNLEKKKAELEQAQNRINRLMEIKDGLELQNSDLVQQKTRLNQQVQNLEGWLSDLEDNGKTAAGQQPFLYAGEILGAKIVEPGISKNEALKAVVEPLLGEANDLVLKRGVHIRGKDDVIRSIPGRILDICAQIAALKTKAVLRAVIDRNTVAGSPATVDLKLYPDGLIFKDGQAIEEVKVASDASQTELRDRLLSLLILAKTKAIDEGIMTKGPDPGSAIPANEIDRIIQRIKETEGFYKVSLIATDDIRRIDTLDKLKFDIAALD